MSKKELTKAKKLLNILKDDNEWYKEDYTEQALSLIYAYDECGYEFLDEYMLDEMVKHEAESGAARLMFFLAHTEPNAPFGYKLDGYGNARNVERDDIIFALQELIENEEVNE